MRLTRGKFSGKLNSRSGKPEKEEGMQKKTGTTFDRQYSEINPELTKLSFIAEGPETLLPNTLLSGSNFP